MRYLFVDANYPEFLNNVYTDMPDLAAATYAEQMARIKAGLFGEAQFQAGALISLGHEAEVVVANAHSAQAAWAAEHGLSELTRPRRQFRWRRGVIPWWSERSRAVNWDVLLAQARTIRPDVLYIEIMDSIPPAVAERLRSLARFAVAQVATAIPTTAYRAYDLVFSSIPSIVDEFRAVGIPCEWMPLAFEPRVLDLIGPRDRDIPVSFVGSFTDAYIDRSAIVDAVARVSSLQTWTSSVEDLPQGSALRKTVRGSAFGRDMYAVLARSAITLNSHGIVAGPDANNLRLYEATGMGTLLVTDARRNLGQLFEVGREVVTYRSPGEAAEIVRAFLDDHDAARQIAAAGQARTLRDHTWQHRMARVAEAVAARM